VVLQGSVVDVAAAQRALDDGVADAVEMTRAQIADADLVRKARAGVPVRPCTLCNQACQVRDVRNPLVSCVADPSAEAALPDGAGRRVTVVGGGPAGLEAARVLASAGADVRLVERSDRLGGGLHTVAALPGRSRFALLAAWLAGEVARLGVRVELGVSADGGDVLATGARPRGHAVLTAADVLTGAVLPPGPVVVHDPGGGPVGVGMAELLAAAGREVTLVTPDEVVGVRLGGDLAPANARLARAGVRRETSSVVLGADEGVAVLADRWTGEERPVPCAVLVDAGPLLPGAVPPGALGAGDAVAPRTVLEAVLEGRRAARAVLASPQVSAAGRPARPRSEGAGRASGQPA
jgi:2,4-dienoyl-CoA reductase (NADPH2)